MCLVHIGLLFFGLLLPLSALSTDGAPKQPWLDVPWAGLAKITQGNHGDVSHNVAGKRSLDKTNKSWENTYAIDVALEKGCRVLAAADGVVSEMDGNNCGTSGRFLAIRHKGEDGSEFETVYMHLDKILVQNDEIVLRNEVVALSGASSACKDDGTSAHLHFHLWAGAGSRDSHTQPIEQLNMQGSDGETRSYDARLGELDSIAVNGKNFRSQNRPILASLEPSGLERYGLRLTNDGRLQLNGRSWEVRAWGQPPTAFLLIELSPSRRYGLGKACDETNLCNDYLLDGVAERVVEFSVGKYGASDWVSWSPNEEYVLQGYASHGEQELYVLHLPSGILRDVQLFPALALRDNRYDSAGFDQSSIKWLEGGNFRLNIKAYCNEHNDSCVDKLTGKYPQPLPYTATVNAESLKVDVIR